jgi:nitrogen-specific signal transduction histidine kinase/CheY-like chemotaxis protein
MINSDITEKKQLEEKFFRAQRLQAIGTLASGIAHDLNNILAPIMMCAPLVREERSDEGRGQLLDIVEASTQRAVGIVKQLLGFGRGQGGQKISLQIGHLVRDVARIARETFPRSIQIREHCAPDLLAVIGDATQLHQVLLNLCVNARDAMPAGGTLTLRAENAVVDENYASARAGMSAGSFVRIQVQDTGTGIPESVRGHIFESFFTTKAADQGTGLGLTTVLGIVENHHGFINFTTAEGKGTTFEVHLPGLPEAAPVAIAKEVSSTEARANGELILLVDDEPAIREAERKTLERRGYSALLAQDGIEALAHFVARQAEVRAVVTDCMMPHMDGVMLARALRRLSPQTPIIVSSGGLLDKGGSQALAAFSALGIRHILHKPHNAEILLQALEELVQPRTRVLPGPAGKP